MVSHHVYYPNPRLPTLNLLGRSPKHHHLPSPTSTISYPQNFINTKPPYPSFTLDNHPTPTYMSSDAFVTQTPPPPAPLLAFFSATPQTIEDIDALILRPGKYFSPDMSPLPKTNSYSKTITTQHPPTPSSSLHPLSLPTHIHSPTLLTPLLPLSALTPHLTKLPNPLPPPPPSLSPPPPPPILMALPTQPYRSLPQQPLIQCKLAPNPAYLNPESRSPSTPTPPSPSPVSKNPNF